jgi:hypothetical protein
VVKDSEAFIWKELGGCAKEVAEEVGVGDSKETKKEKGKLIRKVMMVKAKKPEIN